MRVSLGGLERTEEGDVFLVKGMGWKSQSHICPERHGPRPRGASATAAYRRDGS